MAMMLRHLPSRFVLLSRLRTGLLGFVKPVSDTSNRLRETRKSRTSSGLVWQSITPHVCCWHGAGILQFQLPLLWCQVKNIIYHTVKDAIAVLDDDDPPEERH